MAADEQTLVLIKPDALKLSLTGYIISTFAEHHSGLRLAGSRVVHVTRQLAEQHYTEHVGKPFFPGLIDYLTGRLHYPQAPERRRVVALVYHGPNAVRRVREMAGPTNPHDARDRCPGTVRALGTLVMGRDGQGRDTIDRIDNLVHASGNPVEAEREIKLWFRPTDLMPFMRVYATAVCESHYYHQQDGSLTTAHHRGDVCLLAPGDLVWASDLDALECLVAGRPSPVPLAVVAAKYLVNVQGEA